MKTLQDLSFCPSPADGLKQKFIISFLTTYILLSITAFFGNSLILAALHKESSLYPPSKLLYRCLATTDLLVGLVTQPLFAIFWMSVARERWNLCRYAFDLFTLTGSALVELSSMTMTAVGVDRLLTLLLGLR